MRYKTQSRKDERASRLVVHSAWFFHPCNIHICPLTYLYLWHAKPFQYLRLKININLNIIYSVVRRNEVVSCTTLNIPQTGVSQCEQTSSELALLFDYNQRPLAIKHTCRLVIKLNSIFPFSVIRVVLSNLRINYLFPFLAFHVVFL